MCVYSVLAVSEWTTVWPTGQVITCDPGRKPFLPLLLNGAEWFPWKPTLSTRHHTVFC